MLKRDTALESAAFFEAQRFPDSLGTARCWDVARALDQGNTVELEMDELQHRMKNMMSVILSISRQTMLYSATKEDFDQQFSARLTSYGKSIDRLIENNWRGLGIHDLIRTQLSVFDDNMQISAEGPDLHISARLAHSIGLALHELATNAVKYGSLSVPQGRVLISWSVSKVEAEDRFQLQWRELDGPTVMLPKCCGFGRRLIQGLNASANFGKTTYDFHPSGVRWSLDAPASTALG